MKNLFNIIMILLVCSVGVFAEEPPKSNSNNKGMVTKVLGFMGVTKNFGDSLLPKGDTSRSISSESEMNYENSGIVQSSQGIIIEVLPSRGSKLNP